jgi:hypothetical protein
MLTDGDKKSPKIAQKFYCDYCDYFCSKQSEWDRHILRLKHTNVDKMLTNVDKMLTKNRQKSPDEGPSSFLCECGKKYKHRQSLSIHKKKCYANKPLNETTNINDKEIIMSLLDQNNQLQNKIIDLCKNMQPTIHNNNNNINSNNKTFNLNVFLNETCKDAMNIMDFVDSLKIQLSDLENVGKLGFVEGISNIIIKNLKALDIHKRPVHCSDSKREVMYIKDENKWEKENNEKKKLRKAIKHIAHKNTKMLPEFKAKYPDCGKSDSKYADQYNKLVIEAMGGKGDNEIEKEDKIIKKIAKEVIIEKEL